MKSVFFCVIGIGLLLLFASAIWVSMAPGTSSWTQEKDQRLTQIGNRMHLLQFQVGNAESKPTTYGGIDLPKSKAELAGLKEENKQLMDEFKGIQAKPYRIATVMKWSGISLAIVGIVGWYAVNQSR